MRGKRLAMSEKYVVRRITEFQCWYCIILRILSKSQHYNFLWILVVNLVQNLLHQPPSMLKFRINGLFAIYEIFAKFKNKFMKCDIIIKQKYENEKNSLQPPYR